MRVLTERIKPSIKDLGLICPDCSSRLTFYRGESFICLNSKCGSVFPVVLGVPVLIGRKSTLFKKGDYVSRNIVKRKKIWRSVKRLIPSLSLSIRSDKNFRTFREVLNTRIDAKCLVIGCGEEGVGIKSILDDTNISVINTDVVWDESVDVIADGHSLPFQDEMFDGVIIQAVLEHVVDPAAVVQEAYRVLNEDAIVYAEAPFIQQVHMAEYDFYRFTCLGLRRLFRNFNSLDFGTLCGPAMAFLWSLAYFVVSFFPGKKLKKGVMLLLRILFFWIKYFDILLINGRTANDAASACYFFGRKACKSISDEEIISQFKGMK